MDDKKKTKAQLIDELEELRKRNAEFEAAETERKENVGKLNEQFKFLQIIINIIPNPIFIKDKDGKYLGCNTSYEEYIGITKEEIIGKTVYDMWPKENAEKYYTKDQELFKNPGKQVYEWKVTKKTGETRDVIFNKATFTDEKKKIGGLIGVISDITERKKAEEALKESKERFREVLENSSDASYKRNLVTEKYEYMSPVIAEIIGYSQEEITAMSPSDIDALIHPEDIRIINKFKQRLIEEPDLQSGTAEYRIKCKDGIYRWISDHFTLYKDSEGQLFSIASVRDITERKKAEEALIESEEKYRSIVEINPDIIYQLDTNGIITFMSPRINEIIGKISEELIGKNISEIVYKDDLDKVERINERRTGKRAVRRLELRLTGKKGIRHVETRYVGINATGVYENGYNGDGKIESRGEPKGEYIGTHGTITDITERKKTEDLIKFLSSITENIIDSILVTDTNFTITYANKAFEELFGYKLDELKGKTPDILNAEPNAPEIQQEIYQTVSSGETLLGESLNKRKDGSTFYCEYKVMPLEDEQGNIYSYVGIQRDITERKQLEEERVKTSNLESIGVFAGGIAHDFNNILAAILGNISLAKMDIDSKSEEFELLTDAENVTYRAKDLTQQLLTFAKGGAPVKETTELIELIRETTRFSLRGSNVNYRTSIAPDLRPVEIDRGQISQVINNLFINADQSMPEGGTINIKAKNVTVTPVDNLLLKEGNYIKISLEDKGHGIPKEQLTKIFDPYFTTKQKGSGLGLATAFSIIHRHDGHITVESEMGVGTTFHIYLPASSKQAEKKEELKEEAAVMTGKILVMDDDEMVRNFVSRVLKSFGNEVEVVRDGAEAIELYRKAMDSGKPFDVVILDLTIPGGMGGKKAIKKLLEIDPDAKAVVSSGYSNDPVVSNFEEYGFKGNISKPYRLKELKKVLNEVMKKEND